MPQFFHELRVRVPRAGQSEPAAREPAEYNGSRFSEVWSALESDPYVELPQRIIRLRDVVHYRALKQIYQASRRTLHTRADLLPVFDKPVHPVGTCLRGTWAITEPTPYTGYFRQGKRALIIARASDNMGETRPGKLRFLALAGKLYPTTDPHHSAPLRTANFLSNENLIGTHTRHYLDARLATDLLPFHMHLDPRLKVPAGLLVATTFALAERSTHLTQPLRRQLYPIAQLGEPPSHGCRAPQVMRLVPDPSNRRVDTPDFRRELDMRHHPHGIRYTIEVSDERSYLVPASFRAIGHIHFTASVASFSGDHRLHFHHPEYRPDAAAVCGT